MKKWLVGLALGALAASANVSAAEEKDSITFAVIQDIRMSVSAEMWEKPLDYMSKRIGKKISFYQTTSYASVVEAMLGGFVDVAKLGPNAYILAAEKSKGAIVPVASFAREGNIFNPDPCACYYARLITRNGGPYKDIASLKGKAVLGLVDPGSTSGDALPRALFPAEIGGATLESYFPRIIYTGSHDASNLAVHQGKIDAAFIAESTLVRMIEKGEVKKEDYNYLWRSAAIPIDTMAINTKTVSKELREKITAVLVGMHETPEGRAMLKLLERAQFAPATDATFDPLRKILDAQAKAKAKK